MSKRYDEETLRRIVCDSISIRQVLLRLGYAGEGGNYGTLKRKFQDWDIDTSHFTGQAHLRNKSHNWSRKRSLKEILVEDSTYTNSCNLKNRLLQEGVKERQCERCGRKVWEGAPIPLELHHENGIRNDHRLENIFLLCPNCHSFTNTYRGRNMGRRVELNEYECGSTITKKIPQKQLPKKCECGEEISQVASQCPGCYLRRRGSDQRSKALADPETIEMFRLATEECWTLSAIARKYDISFTAVKKRVKRLGWTSGRKNAGITRKVRA